MSTSPAAIPRRHPANPHRLPANPRRHPITLQCAASPIAQPSEITPPARPTPKPPLSGCRSAASSDSRPDSFPVSMTGRHLATGRSASAQCTRCRTVHGARGQRTARGAPSVADGDASAASGRRPSLTASAEQQWNARPPWQARDSRVISHTRDCRAIGAAAPKCPQ